MKKIILIVSVVIGVLFISYKLNRLINPPVTPMLKHNRFTVITEQTKGYRDHRSVVVDKETGLTYEIIEAPGKGIVTKRIEQTPKK